MNKAKETKLIASIAVFAELCNTEKDLQSIIAEFILSIFAFERTWEVNSYEATLLLKKHFDFDLPEAVVKTCLNTLKNKGFLERKEGKYFLINNTYNVEAFSEKLGEKKNIQERMETELIDYYESLINHKADDYEKTKLVDSLIAYLFDKAGVDEYSTIIDSFVINKSHNDEFVQNLNQFKEGLVILTGLQYTDDLNNIGRWNDELNIYLDTEMLFHFAGYNGILYKTLFDDFYNLVKEVNQSSEKRIQKKLIHLKYFEQVKNEMDNFFYVAEKIIKREANASPHNSAMLEICKGCSTPADILRKMSSFEMDLRTSGIFLQPELDYYSNPQFNIEDTELIKKYEDQYDGDNLFNVLHSFTKINFLRKGANRTKFERCGHIILTGKIITRILSKDLEIKNEAKDIPFATDIDFLTNRIWFRLNKGLSKNSKLPSTLDSIIKAQIAISSQVNKSVEKKFEELKSELNKGKISSADAQNYYYHLREQAKRPEEITPETIKDSIEFIFEHDLENHLKEKSSLERKVQEGELAIRKLNQLNSQRLRNKKRSLKIRIRIFYVILNLFLFSIPIILLFSIGYFIYKLSTSSDTPLSIISLIFSILIEIPTIIKFKKIHKWIGKKLRSHYLRLAAKFH